MVVDDSEANTRILDEYLTECGFKVITVDDGRKALELATSAAPNLILLDVVMPHVDGFETCRQLKANEATREIPVIFTTSLSRTTEKVKGFRVGAVDYITKPYQLDEVLARVGAHLTIVKLQKSLQIQNKKLQQEINDRKRIERELRRSQQQSEQLLLNVLPRGIIARLKKNPGTIAHHYEDATVLFADIVDFSQLTVDISPTQLINLLNNIFSTFDELVEHHQLEKIKTIGDEYLVVGGVPNPLPRHVEAMAEMALDMQQAITQFRDPEGRPITIRVGINTGPVVAGIIGRKKFSYDLWGSTVNIASRMASSGISGRTQVTPATYERLRDYYHLSQRGVIDVKGMGEMTTYFLDGRKTGPGPAN